MDVEGLDPQKNGADVGNVARAINPQLSKLSAQSELGRSLDNKAVMAISESGFSRMLTPKKFGGYELPISAHINACLELAHGCPAASWVHMVCGAHTFVAARYPEACQEEVFGASPDVLIPGALAPQGKVRKTNEGWILSGRWQFGSGADHGPWLMLGATLDEKDSDEALALHLIAPSTEVEIHDTWYTLGMRGTGSQDLVADNVFVPNHRAMPTAALFKGDFDGHVSPIYRLPVMSGLASMLAGTVVGIAQSGLNWFRDATRVRQEVYTGQSKAQKPGIQLRVAESMGEIELAAALVEQNCRILDEAALSGNVPMGRAPILKMRWNAAYAVELSRRATERVYSAAGANATYDQSPLQRWYRDVNTACHHAIVDFDTVLEARGRSLLGLSAGTPL